MRHFSSVFVVVNTIRETRTTIKRRVLMLVAVALLAVARPALAGPTVYNVFDMPAGDTSLQFVPVGSPGNVADTTGYGAVGYAYEMGEYDVTLGQYCQFLNAVAASDTYGVYATGLGTTWAAPMAITRSGSKNNYTYAVTGTDPQAANCPTFNLTWGDCVRFINWLANGQPIGPEGAATTERGVYTLNGATSATALMAVTRSSTEPAYFLPNENEWYKAAYYNNNGAPASAGTYWVYPTQSNTAPGNTLPDTGNNANIYANFTYADPTNYLTPVGDFSASPGPFGTYDMGGDINQWTEGVQGSSRVIRGGWCELGAAGTDSSSQDLATPTASQENYGAFRVASFLEPGDANGDGRVDINDLTILLTNYGLTGTTWIQGEFTGDGTVDVNDLTIVLANFGYGVTAAGGLAAVPEPSGLVLIGLGVVSLVACIRFRRSSCFA
jgi:formylglycine-generating enzyme required for sulfatase activity